MTNFEFEESKCINLKPNDFFCGIGECLNRSLTSDETCKKKNFLFTIILNYVYQNPC